MPPQTAMPPQQACQIERLAFSHDLPQSLETRAAHPARAPLRCVPHPPPGSAAEQVKPAVATLAAMVAAAAAAAQAQHAVLRAGTAAAPLEVAVAAQQSRKPRWGRAGSLLLPLGDSAGDWARGQALLETAAEALPSTAAEGQVLSIRTDWTSKRSRLCQQRPLRNETRDQQLTDEQLDRLSTSAVRCNGTAWPISKELAWSHVTPVSQS